MCNGNKHLKYQKIKTKCYFFTVKTKSGREKIDDFVGENMSELKII